MKDDNKDKKRAIHFILQGKGGVGKSMIASLLMQYMINKDIKVTGVDTDPNNSTFHNYDSLNVTRLDIAEGHKINTRKFDSLIEIMSQDNGDYIIDSGANTFMPFFDYINESNLFDILQNDLNFNVYIHTVITAGQAKIETIKGVERIVTTSSVPENSVILWENEFWGKIDPEKELKNYKIMKSFSDIFVAGITIHELNRDTFGQDISDMLDKHLTFEEVKQSELFSFMSKKRIHTFKEEMFAKMSDALSVIGY